ncbi:MAG: Do family serine endopeptidase [Gammaproteobacteria bacterium]|nr:Do family serine endopeptidase [Gammaproteobacteria bacterium]
MNTRFILCIWLLISMALNVVSAGELPNFTKLIKENAQTVVQIESRDIMQTTQTQGNYHHGQPMPDDLLRYFFEAPQNRNGAPNRSMPSLSHGSGFFIDEQGFIITNAHVVKGGDEIIVSTTEQKEYKAELIGLDERTDVALLKINKDNTPAVKVGNSDSIEVGNWVLAIGSPFGFDYTATKGIVSAVSRSLPDGTYVPFIQTDAAVNPGNSGGPLFNLDGEVIGVNSQIYSRTGSFNGLAFAIPINTAIHIAQQLKSKGFVSRGWLGVGIQSVNQDLARSFGLDTPKGALVANVAAGSPAQYSGLKVGDVILGFNGKAIRKSSDLPPLVGTVNVGTAVDVEILRNGEKQTLSVTIGELDEGQPKLAKKPHVKNNRGLIVSALTARKRQEAGIDNGVLVTEVLAGSKAADMGFRPGDVIVNVDNQEINSADEFYNLLSSNNNQHPLAVLVIRQGRSLFIPL